MQWVWSPGDCPRKSFQDQDTPLESRDASEDDDTDIVGWDEYSAKANALPMETGIFTTRVSEPYLTVTYDDEDTLPVFVA